MARLSRALFVLGTLIGVLVLFAAVMGIVPDETALTIFGAGWVCSLVVRLVDPWIMRGTLR